MKRMIALFATALVFSGAVHASDFNIGLRGGVNFSSVPTTQAETTVHRFVALSESYTGWHLGVVSQLVFTGFYLQPELLYSRSGIEMRREVIDAGTEQDVYFRQTYDQILLPLTAGAKIGPVRLGAGPVFSWMVDDSHDLGEQWRQDFRDFTLGLRAGIGLNLGNLLLDLKYETSLTNMSERFRVNGNFVEFDTRPRQYVLSIGFLF